MNQCFKTRNNLQFCFTLKLQKCFKKKLKVSSACGRVEDTAFSFWENIYFKMFIILSESTFKNKLAESNSLKSTQSMSTNFMYKHTHTHCFWPGYCLLAVAEDWVAPFSPTPPIIGKQPLKPEALYPRSLSHERASVSNSDGLPWCGVEQEAVRGWKVSTLLNFWATAPSGSAEA